MLLLSCYITQINTSVKHFNSVNKYKHIQVTRANSNAIEGTPVPTGIYREL